MSASEGHPGLFFCINQGYELRDFRNEEVSFFIWMLGPSSSLMESHSWHRLETHIRSALKTENRRLCWQQPFILIGLFQHSDLPGMWPALILCMFLVCSDAEGGCICIGFCVTAPELRRVSAFCELHRFDNWECRWCDVDIC